MYKTARGFATYAKVANKMCLVYTGISPEHVVQLDLVRRAITTLEVSLAVTDRFSHLANDLYPIDQVSDSNFGHIIEFKTNPTNHMVLNFIRDAKLVFLSAPPTVSKICLICPDAIHPVKPFTPIQIESAKRLAVQKRLEPVMARSIEDVKSAGWVIGPENEYVFMARDRATLVGSGPGTDLYRLMFPRGEIRERI